MNETIIIEKNVPIPQTGTAAKYPFSTMQIGESFVVPAGKRNSMSACVVRHRPKKFVSRIQPDKQTVRIWRVE